MSDAVLQQLTLPVLISCLGMGLLGLISILRGPSIIRQIFGFKLLLLAVELFFLHSGALHHQLPETQTLIVIMLVVESIFMAVALALITKYYEHFPSGKFHLEDEEVET